jgi:pSer/pThr/pTyr-binding forkhead associated (FHA) protein
MSAVASAGCVVRIKLPSGWVNLPAGAYEIGRSAHCQIVLDGAKVSRLHARLVVTASGATIEDLESSNGVFVNGKRLGRGPRSLVTHDRLVIGDVEVDVVIERASGAQFSARGSERPTLLDLIEDTNPGKPSGTTEKANALELLGTVAEQAINAGDARRAEGIVKDRLEQVADQARRGKGDPDSALLAFRLAMLLAKTLPSAKWFDFGVDLLIATGLLPTDDQLAHLEAAAEAVAGASTHPIQELSLKISALPPSMDKLRALSRLEGVLDKVRTRR